ncbi:Alpha/Beta hydrolase protein [Plectosphaerella plurivora]|uniref:Alpha/Beta hydrolase protein n=1 Tax=Plectosphaerella plurivora TaxID=936078 RepID=A0A9P8VB95_9PEZI|nr:Alpha/Beta hydrolase protein [Plectosphaerella plurivora]
MVSVYQSESRSTADRPCFFFVHGGGQISGNRHAVLDTVMGYMDGIDVVTVTVEYRLAPEHPAPAGLNDCFTALTWVANNAAELRIDPSKIIVCGISGGAPLAASAVIKARDAGFPNNILAQMLITPMLDDRATSVSARQFHVSQGWSGSMNNAAWNLALEGRQGEPDVPEMYAPARVADLSGLPAAYIDAGACEVFRDEAVAYASKLWECGVNAELHFWPGAYHMFDQIRANTRVARDSVEVKKRWLKRVLGVAV